MDAEALVSEPKPNDDRVPCPVCAEPIARGTLKCPHCSSDLRGARRYFTVANAALLILGTVGSVGAAYYPGILHLMTPSRSKISISYGGVTHTYVLTPPNKVFGQNVATINVLVTNSGRGTAAVDAVGYRVSFADFTLSRGLHEESEEVHYVEGLKTEPISRQFSGAFIWLSGPFGRVKNFPRYVRYSHEISKRFGGIGKGVVAACSIVAEVKNSDSTSEEVTTTIPCSEDELTEIFDTTDDASDDDDN